MLTLRPERFDFRESFPLPRVTERCQAGRPGPHERTEDFTNGDADRVASQHRAWFDELLKHYIERAYLLSCIEARTDPGTGAAPIDAGCWWVIETRARAEVLWINVTVQAIFGDYESEFGEAATRAFYAFVLESLEGCAQRDS